jgi:tRNA(Ile)-lysidine synthase
MSPFPERVILRWAKLKAPGVIAVSGGADSVALLRCLVDSIKPLVVAHVNHRLRGADSDADERFVCDLARSLSLECRSISIDVKEMALLHGANLEDTARQVRYDWLGQIARECGAGWIATGHTADDQAETVLHRLIRGAGIQGLRGIAALRELTPGISLVRPLLDVSRAEVIKYLEAKGQRWRDDASNRDPTFTRNRIRLELLPLLKSFNPVIVDVLGRLAEQAGEIHIEQEAAASQLLLEAERPRAGALCIFDVAKLRTASRHCVRGMFRLLWEREGWPLRDMTFEHWKKLVAVALDEASAVDFPGGVHARWKGNVLQVGRNERET